MASTPTFELEIVSLYMYSVTPSPLVSVPVARAGERHNSVVPDTVMVRASAAALKGWTKTAASANALRFESEMRTAIAVLNWSRGRAVAGLFIVPISARPGR